MLVVGSSQSPGEKSTPYHLSAFWFLSFFIAPCCSPVLFPEWLKPQLFGETSRSCTEFKKAVPWMHLLAGATPSWRAFSPQVPVYRLLNNLTGCFTGGVVGVAIWDAGGSQEKGDGVEWWWWLTGEGEKETILVTHGGGFKMKDLICDGMLF